MSLMAIVWPAVSTTLARSDAPLVMAPSNLLMASLACCADANSMVAVPVERPERSYYCFCQHALMGTTYVSKGGREQRELSPFKVNRRLARPVA